MVVLHGPHRRTVSLVAPVHANGARENGRAAEEKERGKRAVNLEDALPVDLLATRRTGPLYQGPAVVHAQAPTPASRGVLHADLPRVVVLHGPLGH